MNHRYFLPLVLASVMFCITATLAGARIDQPIPHTITQEEVPNRKTPDPVIGTLDDPLIEEPIITDLEPEFVNETILLGYVNDERRMQSLEPLRLLPTLNVSADMKAYDMQRFDYFEHENRDGRQGYDFIDDAGQTCHGRGEVLFDNSEWEDTILADAVRGWMRSLPHRKILVSTEYNSVGFGISERYVVGHFCNAPDENLTLSDEIR